MDCDRFHVVEVTLNLDLCFQFRASRQGEKIIISRPNRTTTIVLVCSEEFSPLKEGLNSSLGTCLTVVGRVNTI